MTTHDIRLAFRALPRLSALLFVVAVPWVNGSACYDSSWNDARRQRQHAIDSASGAEVTAGEERREIRHVGRVRVYASADYRARRPNWEGKVDDWVDRASAILGPALGVRLELVDTREWDPACDPDELSTCLDELYRDDPGDDVDWVFGLIGSIPRFSNSFEQLGLAATPGRHSVVRDLHDLREREAIDEVFWEMSASQREEIYQSRRRHKRLVLFLHEWAHTLGALHTKSRETILHPSYHDDIASFTAGNRVLMEAALVDHFGRDPSYASLRAALEHAPSDDWRSGERERLVSRLQTLSHLQRAPSGAPASGSTPSAPAVRVAEDGSVQHPFLIPGRPDELLEGVSTDDRERYQRAVRELTASELEAAWSELLPLIEAYPANYAIQNFACSLAMQLGKGEHIGPTCDRTIQLASAAGG